MICKDKKFGHNFIRTGMDYYVCSQCGIDQKELSKKPQKIEFQIKESKITNERQLVLKDFLVQLNWDRKNSGYKPYSPAYLGFKLSYLSVQDLYFFYSQCKQAKNFSKYFHWALKPNKGGAVEIKEVVKKIKP